MQRLGPQDASFIYLETPFVHQHVGGLSIVNPSSRPDGELKFESVVEVIASRLHLAPRFRQKVVTPPFGAGRPVWVDDVDFDIDFHMRRAALPAPGGRRELVDYVQRVISRPLDRTKPLWETYLIEGMEGGMAALLTKVHHAMVDGLAAIDIATVIFDFTPEPQILTPEPWVPEPEPSRMDLLRDALADQLRNPIRAATETAQHAMGSPSRVLRQLLTTVQGVGDVLGKGIAPQSPFNQRVGPNRRFAMMEAPVSAFKEVKNAFGGTVNDVVLATVAGGLHRLLRYRREPTRERVLRAMVPVSVRAEDEKSALGNRVSTWLVDLPVGPMGAKKRLALISLRTQQLKESNQAVGAEFIMNVGMWAPPTLHGMAARLAARGRFINLVVSNVPGPQIPLYIAGARLLASYPIMPIAENMGLSIACTSLSGTMAFGLTADWDTVPDIEFLAAAMDESLAEMLKAAGK